MISDDFTATYNVFFSYEKAMIDDVKVEFEFDKDEPLNSAMDKLMRIVDLGYEFIGENRTL